MKPILKKINIFSKAINIANNMHNMQKRNMYNFKLTWQPLCKLQTLYEARIRK